MYRQFGIEFSRKAHDIVAFFWAPIDGDTVDFRPFIGLYQEKVQRLEDKRLQCVFMDKINYTAFITVFQSDGMEMT